MRDTSDCTVGDVMEWAEVVVIELTRSFKFVAATMLPQVLFIVCVCTSSREGGRNASIPSNCVNSSSSVMVGVTVSNPAKSRLVRVSDDDLFCLEDVEDDRFA